MCGIAGIYSAGEARAPLEPALSAMVAAMRHRGPDEQSVLARGRVGLGVARLSIIDPAGSHQPLSNETGDVLLVFNGEIYNYLELRPLLEKEGHRFATRGDGEVIVHGYEQWGTGVFERLRGMFAIAIWDERAQRLVLARDRMGIKPLYLARTPNTILFASEAKALFASDRVSPELRPELLDCYLTFRYLPAPDTLFRGISKLEPGEWLSVKNGVEESGRYYTPAFLPKQQIGEKEAAGTLRGLMDRSMDFHLRSDAPLGVFLSGGLDSGFLVALARERVSGPLNTFTVGFDRGGIYDETAAAAVVANRYNTLHRIVRMTATDYLRMLPEAVYHMDEPMADPSAVPMMAISRLAREYVKVVLSGEGSDELFAGYPRYPGEILAARVPVPGALTRLLARTIPMSRSRRRGLEGIGIRDDARRHLFWETIIREETRAALLGALPEESKALSILQRIQSQAEGDGELEAIDRLLAFDLRAWLVDDLLLKKDKMGMSASIEARVPYLDQDVVSFALQLPASLKVRGMRGKRVFRRAIASALPAEILARPKVGFAVPLDHWFRHELSGALEELLTRGGSFLAPYVSRDEVRRMLESHRAGNDRSLELLTLLVLELWGSIHVRGEAAAELLAARGCRV